MIDDKGNLVSDPKMIVNNFQLYFEKLLNIPMHHEIDNANGIWEQDEGQMSTVQPEVLEPTLEDIKVIVESLRNNKAPGENNINAEVLKLVGLDLLKNLHKTISIIWRGEKFEKNRNTAVICPIYKKGDPKKVENYQGIFLLDTSHDVLLIAILHRLEKYLSEIIDEYQCGFMKGKSTTDLIYSRL